MKGMTDDTADGPDAQAQAQTPAQAPARIDPIRPTDDAARDLARGLLGSRHAALGVIDPATGAPHVTRVAFGWQDGAGGLLLVSTLSLHTGALHARPDCSVLLGEPADRGDPLTHPRLTLTGRAVPADKAALRDLWLRDHPKAALYIDFADFRMLRLEVAAGHLNGGFGRAFRLTPADLGLPDPAPDPRPAPP